MAVLIRVTPDVYARAMSSTVERSFDAVLFDWCGTLVEYPLDEDRFRPVLQRLGRPHDDTALGALVAAYRDAAQHPDALEADERCDLSAQDHRSTKLLICELAGIDHEFAVELERSYGDFATYPTYPEVVGVVTALAASGVKIAVVSDFHVDLRPHLDSLGLIDHISGFVLSCEIGTTKPDPRMFQAALDLIAVPPERCLMVGDNPRPDTGAAALGIATLILPLQRAPRPPLLDRVLSLVFSEH
jgi:HAD superfamily hydrolase (TIGR01509 family)